MNYNPYNLIIINIKIAGIILYDKILFVSIFLSSNKHSHQSDITHPYLFFRKYLDVFFFTIVKSTYLSYKRSNKYYLMTTQTSNFSINLNLNILF